jgi:hypothetical protein
MTTLNSKIVNTINTLASLGFVCKNETKMNILMNIQEGIEYSGSDKTVHEISMKHKDCFSFAHIRVDYHSTFNRTVKSVKFLISDDKFGFTSSSNRYINVSEKESVVTNKTTTILNNILAKTNEEKNTAIVELERLPIVTKELQSIFGNDIIVSIGKLGGNVFFKYKNKELSFSLYSTQKVADLDLYQTSINFGNLSNKSMVSASTLKTIIDIIDTTK